MPKKLENIFPKDNYYLTMVYALCMSAILFQLNWYQIIITTVIDALSFFCVSWAESLIFYKIYPKYLPLKNFFVSTDAIKSSGTEQNEFFKLLSLFPGERSFYCFFGSLVKVVPVGLYVSYVSDIHFTFGQTLLLFYLADIFIIIYNCGLLFIELHNIASQLMSDLRDHEGWKESYRQLNLFGMKDRLFFTQNFLLVTMLSNLLLMVVYISYSYDLKTHYSFFFLFGSAILCIGKLQFMFQQFFTSTLTGMFNVFNKNLTAEKLEILPMHTSPMLVGFEYAFNQLGSKLELREHEISQWLRHESDQFHLRTLGEITGLVAHDMKTPLHVMQMSLDILKEPTTNDKLKEKYLQILDKNLAQTISFSETLMAYLRGSKETAHCHFGEVHHHLIDLFRTQFLTDNFDKIEFNLSPELSQLELKVSRLNAMHVFYNLYQNALKSILSTVPDHPQLTLWSEPASNDKCVFIYIKDNGSGLGTDEFHNIIHFTRFKSQSQFGNGLGLRLTHRLVSHLEGSLDIIPSDEGTCLRVEVPLLQKKILTSEAVS